MTTQIDYPQLKESLVIHILKLILKIHIDARWFPRDNEMGEFSKW